MGRTLVPAVALAAGALLVASMVGSALAQSPLASAGPPDATQGPSTEQLAVMMLTADDLPAGLTPGGIGDASSFPTDTADFQANGGLGVAQQTWTASAAVPVYIVFDFRFAFSTDEAAQAYLDAAEPVLSEAAASGLTLVPGDTGVGDGYKHYAGTAVANGQTVQMHSVLFRVGPVVAKEFVGGYGTTADDVRAIAEAAFTRMAFVVAPDSNASPAISSAPESSPAPEVAASPGASSADGLTHQWATMASASSAYGTSGWSPQEATGSPDVTTFADSEQAWAPSSKDGTIEWLELWYDQAVVPSAVSIHESSGPGSVTKVEAYDTRTATWTTLWQGTDPTPGNAIGIFTPPLAGNDVAVDRVRVTIDTSVPDWNEIDAVELVGTPPG